MFLMRVAGLMVEVDHLYDYVREFCGDFVIPPEEAAGYGIAPDIRIKVTEEDVDAAAAACPEPLPREEAETIAVSKALARRLPEFGAAFLHAAVFCIEGRAYAIAANSGTGKTTLLRSCGQLLPNRIRVINGDKPIIRVSGPGEKIIACSSPWRGKECWGENISAPLHALVLLSRGTQPRMEERDSFESLGEVVQHLYVPEEGFADPRKFLQVLECLLSGTKVYRFSCPNSIDAAEALLVGLLAGQGER